MQHDWSFQLIKSNSIYIESKPTNWNCTSYMHHDWSFQPISQFRTGKLSPIDQVLPLTSILGFLGGLLITLGSIPGTVPITLLGLPPKRRMVISVNPQEILGLVHFTMVPPKSVNIMVFVNLHQNLFDNLWFCGQRGFLVKTNPKRFYSPQAD